MRISRSTPVAALIVLAASCVLAAPASALEVSGGSTIQIFELAAEDNALTITGSGGTYLVTDTAVAPTPGTGCVATATPNAVSCTTTGSSLNGFGLQGSDTVTVAAADLSVNWTHTTGGPIVFDCGASPTCYVAGSGGNDTITGGPGFDTLIGNGGNDVLRGQGGADQLLGGAGNDTADGGAGFDQLSCDAGADILIGGPGRFDRYSCDTALTGVTIALDGQPNDGTPGEGDNIAADIELVAGTRHDDVLIGSATAQSLDGGAGNDVLRGGGGADTLQGGDGNDLLQGQGGDDLLDGGEGADRINGGIGTDVALYFDRIESLAITLDNKADDGESGELDNVQSNVEDIDAGSGDDTLVGNVAGNTIRGGGGNDTIDGGAGGDELDGGPGNDVLAGGPGRDELLGGSGNDHIGVVDRTPDLVNCGAGTDTATAQRAFDTIFATCERTTWR